MKAVKIKGPWELGLEDVPVPDPGPGEVLIKVKYCGICGSDLHIFHLGMPEGLVLGHELTGTVAGCGPGVEGWQEGQAVVVNPVYHCGGCYYCRRSQFNRCLYALAGPGLSTAGGLAEYMVAKAYMIRKLPDPADCRSGALAEPVAVALRAVRLAGVSPGEVVLVVGAGPIGLLVASLAGLAGARALVVEKNEDRRNLAQKMGVYKTLRPDDLNDLYRETEAGADAAFECSGTAEGFSYCFKTVKSGGVIVNVGITFTPFEFDPFTLTLKEIRIQGSYGYTDEFEQARFMIERGFIDVSPLISCEVPLEEVQNAFTALSGNTGWAKVLVKP